MINRKGPWEGYRRQVKRRLARRLLPPSFARSFIERERRLGTKQVRGASYVVEIKPWRLV